MRTKVVTRVILVLDNFLLKDVFLYKSACILYTSDLMEGVTDSGLEVNYDSLISINSTL